MGLILYLRQNKIFRLDGVTEMHYAGSNPQNLVSTNGPIPLARRWAGFPNYIDVTDDSSDLHKVKLSFSVDRDSYGVVTPGAFQPKKAASGTVAIEGDTYDLIRQWLVDDVSAPLNSIEVRITDTDCGNYDDFVIKQKDISWCEGGICEFDVVIKQKDELMTCIKRTLITDNWQGWYQTVPLNGKKHPRFSYCNEVRPNGILVLDWFNAATNGVVTALFMLSLLPIINSIIAILFVIQAILNAIPGVSVNWNLAFINPSDILANLEHYFIESAGCGREHPASLIRDFITNVCDKCGVQVDETTAPILFSQVLNIDASDRGQISVPNPYYNAAILYAPVKRGIRRFGNLGLKGNPNTTDFWIVDNGPILALDQFLDQIKGAFNAEWRIQKGWLYFQRKDFYKANQYVYDFTAGSADRDKIVEGVCFEPNEQKYPASCVGIWQPDASDACGNEAGNVNGRGQMNGYVSFAETDNNPNFEGILDKSQGVQMGATKFRLDGASTDYILDAMQVVCNGSVLTPFLNGLFRDFIAPKIREYCDYALLLSGETAVQPKIIIWNGTDYLNAKALISKSGWPSVAPQPMPEKNPAYNNPPQDWHVRHVPQTKVLGSALSFANQTPGRYQVRDYFGLIISDSPTMLPNWPMYFEPWYRDTLWDLFHWIDDPRRNPTMQLNWRVKIELCCEDLKIVKVLDDATDVVLGSMCKIDTAFYPDALIKEITVSYDPSDTYGRYIELKGTL